MNRAVLIAQVKNEYARLVEEQSHMLQPTSMRSPEQYFENVLDAVVHEIDAGKFDHFRSGAEIVEAVANDTSRWLPNAVSRLR